MPLLPASTRARSWLYLGLILLALGVPQLVLVAHTTSMHVDGGYYLDIAMHVRDGRGLVSDVSLYHAGFPDFPHATPIYPLWPLMLGYLGRLVEITWLAHWLPAAFWFASIVLAYLFGSAWWPADLTRVRGLNAGHLAAVMLGTVREYSRFTTMPYTEGLAYALLMGMLWRLAKMQPRWRDLAELGLWLSLLSLTRSQMFIAPIAVAGALGLVVALGGKEGRRWLLPGLGALALVGAALFAWWLHLKDFVLDAGPFTMLRFDQSQVSEVLSPIRVLKRTEGPWDLLVDRLGGLKVAFGPDLDQSYARLFFTQHFALPLAAAGLLLSARRLRWRHLRDGLRHPRAFAWITLVLLALGALASIHLPHKEGFGSWYFHRRHAIICVLPFFLAALYLATRPSKWVRALALALVVGNVAWAGNELYWRLTWALDADHDKDKSIVRWLQKRASAEEPLVVAVWAFKPPELGWRTDHVGYHWFYERTEMDDLLKMFDELGSTYLIFKDDRTEDWRFREDPVLFHRHFEPVAQLNREVRIYRRRQGAQ